MTTLEAAEAEKYRKVWQCPEYRKVSPGMLEAQRAFAVLGMKAGESLVDFGSGTGRATAWFQSQGLRVLAIDHVDNALETDVPFLKACLWELPPLSVDYGFCCDVMEHIPPGRVVPVLFSIARACVKGLYIRIATRPDVMGPRILGEPLHLSIKTADRWREMIETTWGSKVEILTDNGRDVVMVARK
jgi:hypothetical protein